MISSKLRRMPLKQKSKRRKSSWLKIRGGTRKYLLYFSIKTYIVGTHKKRLAEALLMSTHNICFYEEIRKKAIIFS